MFSKYAAEMRCRSMRLPRGPDNVAMLLSTMPLGRLSRKSTITRTSLTSQMAQIGSPRLDGISPVRRKMEIWTSIGP